MDFAKLLKQKKPDIIKIWLEQVRKRVAPAKSVEDPELIDSLPDFLDVISDLLERRGLEEETRRRTEICRAHAEQRHGLTEYDLEAVMHEYEVLQQTIFEVLGREGVVPGEQSRIIAESIFKGVRETAVIFIDLEFAIRDKALSQSKQVVARLNNEQQVREQFVQTLSHDLRQPLTAARASAQLLLRDPSTELRHGLASKIISHLDRADAMITNLLDVGAITSGQGLNLNVREFDMHVLVTRITEDMATIHGERIRREIKGELRGYWDEIKLQRAIINLLENAIKYGWHHTPVTIKSQAEGDRVSISIHNFGSPISAQEIGTMFKPFVRSEAAQKGPVRGWGLGLPLTKGIIEAHGGTIDVSSIDKEGTTFTIKLPRDCRHLSSQP